MGSTVPYPIGVAKLDLRQSLFKDNFKSWEPVLKRFETALDWVSSEGDDRSQRLHHERGQLLGTSPQTLH